MCSLADLGGGLILAEQVSGFGQQLKIPRMERRLLVGG